MPPSVKETTEVTGPRAPCRTFLWNVNRYNLLRQNTWLVCSLAAAVWADSVGVLLLSGDAAFLGCVLCTVALLKTERRSVALFKQVKVHSVMSTAQGLSRVHPSPFCYLIKTSSHLMNRHLNRSKPASSPIFFKIHQLRVECYLNSSTQLTDGQVFGLSASLCPVNNAVVSWGGLHVRASRWKASRQMGVLTHHYTGNNKIIIIKAYPSWNWSGGRVHSRQLPSFSLAALAAVI